MGNVVKLQTPVQNAPSPILRPQNFGELMRFADVAASSDMVPKDYKQKPGNIVLAVQMGSELGLTPMQALQNIAVVNGRPAVWGDAIPGLCKASRVCEDLIETFEGEGDELTAICVAKRIGMSACKATFSVADAKKAGLWGKGGPWTQYPRRMLMWRARGFACRDAFPDILKGLISVEEAHDIPGGQADAGPVIDAATFADEGQATQASTMSELPEYPIVTAKWSKTYDDREIWLEGWRNLIKNCKAAGALDKLGAAKAMNKDNFAAISAFDAAAVNEVSGLLRQALGDEPGAANPQVQPAGLYFVPVSRDPEGHVQGSLYVQDVAESLEALTRPEQVAEWLAANEPNFPMFAQRVRDAIDAALSATTQRLTDTAQSSVTSETLADAAPAEPQPAAEPDKDREWTTRMLGEIAKARTNPRWWREKMPGKLARLEAERPELLAELEQAENDRAAELVMGEPA